MKVELIDYTGKGSPNQAWRAADLMIWTKRTRTEMSSGSLEEIEAWPEEKKLEELRYMSRTIPSSWEFTDYVFLATGVTRAFTLQLVRTRTGSYAQQNQSVQRLNHIDAREGPSIADHSEMHEIWENTLSAVDEGYNRLLDIGAEVQDARGLLPTNVLTNITYKWDLRTCCETFRKRASSERGHGEYHEVIDLMRECIKQVHPWAHIFLDRDIDIAAREAYELIKSIPDKSLRMELSKRIDQITTQS